MLEAVLLVGGQGTRLRPLTLTTPKPMLPVGGVPFLLHQIVKLREAGVGHIVLATSYRAEIFEGYFGDGHTFGVDLTYAVEVEPLGTGGAIRNAADSLRSTPTDPVVIYNGDVLSDHDLNGQIKHHLRTQSAVTLHLVEVPDASAYGCVPTEVDGRVSAFLEKMPEPVTNWVNAGCYVFQRRVMDTVASCEVVSVERDTFPQLLAAGEQLQSWKQSSYWLDVGTPVALVQASADLVLGRCPSSLVETAASGGLVHESAVIGQGASVVGGSYVGENVDVGQGATIDGSIVMDHVVVGAGATVTRSALGRGSSVAADVLVDGVVLGDGERRAS